MSGTEILKITDLASMGEYLDHHAHIIHSKLPDPRLYIALVEGQLAGRCSVIPSQVHHFGDSTRVHYGSHLEVDPKFRGEGIAVQLMRTVFKEHPDFVAFNLSKSAIPVYNLFKFHQVLSLPRSIALLQAPRFRLPVSKPRLQPLYKMGSSFVPLYYKFMLRRLRWRELSTLSFFERLEKRGIYFEPIRPDLSQLNHEGLTIHCAEAQMDWGPGQIVYSIANRNLCQFGVKSCQVLKLLGWQCNPKDHILLLRSLLSIGRLNHCAMIEIPSTGFKKSELVQTGFMGFGAYELFLQTKYYHSLDKGFLMAQHYTPHTAMGDNAVH